MKKKEKCCGGIIFRRRNDVTEFLLIRNHDKFGGFWNFPKGHVEENETEEETAKREIMEEVGLEVDFVFDFRESITYESFFDVEKTVIYFLATPVDIYAEPQINTPEEVHSFMWLDFESAHKRLKYDNSKELLLKVNHFIKEKKL